MSILDSVNWLDGRRHYEDRIRVHQRLHTLFAQRSYAKFATLVLGCDDPAGNYSSVEHGLGPKILTANLNAARQVFNLASSFADLKSARLVPELIRNAGIRYLQIGVGSENRA